MRQSPTHKYPIFSYCFSNYFDADRGAAQKRESVLGGLINACVENLQKQGMTRLFFDGVTGNPSDLIELGMFLEHAATISTHRTRISRMGKV